MQANTEQKINAAQILSFFEESLSPASLTFDSGIKRGTEAVVCPIYFTGCNDTTVVLPPASLEENAQLDSLTDQLASVAGFGKKSIAIPVAYSLQEPEHFVTLFYNAKSKQIIVYKSLHLVDFASGYLPKITKILKKFTSEIAGIKLEELDTSAHSSYLAMYTAIALSNIKSSFSLINLQEQVDFLLNDFHNPEDLRKLKEVFLGISRSFQSNVKQKLAETLRKIRDNPTFLKKILKDRECIRYHKDIDSSKINNDSIVIELNKTDSTSVFLSDPRIINEFERLVLTGNFSISQQVIIASIVAYILSSEFVVLRGKLSPNLPNTTKDGDFFNYPDILIDTLKERLRSALTDEISNLVILFPDIFRNDARLDFLDGYYVDGLEFSVVDVAVQVMCFLVVLVLVSVTVFVMSMYLGVDIGTSVALGVGAISAYGIHTLFKHQLMPGFCKDEGFDENKDLAANLF